MIDIHLISYKNIGPRQDKLITLSLKKGKYLIKSPIGSGKSFLFFDGILYGLYGHSYRDMLNKNSSSGYIKILFEIDGAFYLTIRHLGKNKNIKSLEFYILDYKEDEIGNIVGSYDDVINFDTDFVDQLDVSRFETLDTTRIPEMEEQIRSLIPPRQVFEHQNLFMQSSDNIFELQPKQRIDLLKQIFNLDFLESYKNKISEDKNNISTQIKIYEKDTSYQDKYTQIRNSIKSYLETISSNHQTNNIYDSDLSTLQDIISHPLSDQWGHMDDMLFGIKFTGTLSYISDTKNKHTQLSQTKNLLAQQVVDLQNQIISYDQQINQIQSLLTQTSDIHIDDNILTELEKQKSTVQQDMDKYDDDMYDNQIISLLASEGQDIHISNIQDRQSAISKMIDIGKDKRNAILTWELEKKNIEEEHSKIGQNISSLEEQLEIIKNNEFINHKKSLEEEIKHKQMQIESIKSKIETQKELSVGVENALTLQQAKFDKSVIFYCKKIEANCPFIEQINDRVINNIKSDLEQIQKQKQDISSQIKVLSESTLPIESQITDILNKISELDMTKYVFESDSYTQTLSKIKLLQNQSTSDSHKIALGSIETKTSLAQQTIEKIKDLINNMGGYNNITQQFQARSDHKKKLEDIQNQIISYQKKLNQLQQQKLAIAEKQNQLVTLERDKKKSQDDIAKYDKEIVDITQQISITPIQDLQKLQDDVDEVKRLINRLKDLYDDNKDRELKIIGLKSDLEISAGLFDVFNKEFMLYVLQNYLPVLTDFINTNLYKVVDYQIYIGVNAEGDALEIVVKDDLGDRDVKSLSGGQRAILRLCWILAITYIGNNKILFMDETINNIDPDTIEKVADMLTDFIKQNDLKFYTVTHSTQIQHMNIRDKVIEISR